MKTDDLEPDIGSTGLYLYRVPFAFTVPSQLSSNTHSHWHEKPERGTAHLALPPTIGRHSQMDNLTPGNIEITYSILVTLSKNHAKPLPVIRILAYLPVRIIPVLSSQGEESTLPGGQLDMEYMPDSRRVLIGKRITIQPSTPHAILPISMNRENRCHAKTMIPMMINLRFRAIHGEKLPTSYQVSLRLIANTVLRRFPIPSSSHGSICYTKSKSYSRTIDIGKFQIPLLHWRACFEEDECKWEKESEGSRLLAGFYPSFEDSFEERVYMTKSLIPIQISSSESIVPSFDSCFAMRSYSLDLSFKFQGLRWPYYFTSVNTQIPLHISSIPA